MWYRLHEALRAATRQREGRHPGALAAILDSQSVKTTEEAGAISGYDAAKGVNGRKRHLLVDSSGLVLSALVSPASTQDRDGVRALLAGLAPLVPRLKRIWADGAYSGKALWPSGATIEEGGRLRWSTSAPTSGASRFCRGDGW